MANKALTPSFRFPAALPEETAHPLVRAAIENNTNQLVDVNQAIVSLKNQLDVVKAGNTTNTTNETIIGTSGSGSTAGVTSFNGDSGVVTFFPDLGSVNNQTGQTSYTTQTQDNGALIILNNTSAVSVVLNFAVGTPWYTNLFNSGSGTVTVTATSGTINGGTSLTLLPNYFVTVYFDGVNWEASTLPIVPVNTPAVLHQWLKSYNAATGAFTQTQPAFTDISGTATTAQIGTGTPSAGEYVDGGTGAWTALPGGLSVTITTAALTVGGTQGSMTFTGGRLTAQVQAT